MHGKVLNALQEYQVWLEQREKNQACVYHSHLLLFCVSIFYDRMFSFLQNGDNNKNMLSHLPYDILLNHLFK